MYECDICGTCCRNLNKSSIYEDLDRGDGTCKYLESNLCSINVRLDVLDKKIDDTAAKVKVTMKAVESSTDYQYIFYQGIN